MHIKSTALRWAPRADPYISNFCLRVSPRRGIRWASVSGLTLASSPAPSSGLEARSQPCLLQCAWPRARPPSRGGRPPTLRLRADLVEKRLLFHLLLALAPACLWLLWRCSLLLLLNHGLSLSFHCPTPRPPVYLDPLPSRFYFGLFYPSAIPSFVPFPIACPAERWAPDAIIQKENEPFFNLFFFRRF